MKDLIVLEKIAGWEKLKALVARQRCLRRLQSVQQYGAGRVLALWRAKLALEHDRRRMDCGQSLRGFGAVTGP